VGHGKLENVEKYITESIANIRDDRSVTSTLLTDLLLEMKKTNDLETHKQLGLIASKYGVLELNESDKEQLFDLIQGGEK
jgi:hypothetical protein